MRKIVSLNENWTLTFPGGERPTEAVTLLHTWNAIDGMDGNGSYLRTTGPMHHITDLESYNHYFGWYGGKNRR